MFIIHRNKCSRRNPLQWIASSIFNLYEGGIYVFYAQGHKNHYLIS